LSCEPAVGQLLVVLAPRSHRAVASWRWARARGSAPWLTEGLAGRTEAAILSMEVNLEVAAIARAGSSPPTVTLLVGDVLDLLEGLGCFELNKTGAPPPHPRQRANRSSCNLARHEHRRLTPIVLVGRQVDRRGPQGARSEPLKESS
jgi:hypothetical protein